MARLGKKGGSQRSDSVPFKRRIEHTLNSIHTQLRRNPNFYTPSAHLRVAEGRPSVAPALALEAGPGAADRRVEEGLRRHSVVVRRYAVLVHFIEETSARKGAGVLGVMPVVATDARRRGQVTT